MARKQQRTCWRRAKQTTARLHALHRIGSAARTRCVCRSQQSGAAKHPRLLLSRAHQAGSSVSGRRGTAFASACAGQAGGSPSPKQSAFAARYGASNAGSRGRSAGCATQRAA